MSFKSILALEDGSIFYGEGFGEEKYEVAEVVFNTSMTGYQEILTNSLTNKKYEDDLKLAKNEVVEILNRSSEDLGILKPTPLYTALESVRFNLNRKQESLKFYEFSKTYGRKNGQSIEKNNLCLLRVGNKQEASWMDETTPVTFHHLSGDNQ